jgi:L-alanine-DL-glutamate epimerase-like enolase superfamily enzyme
VTVRAQVVGADVAFIERQFRHPLQLSTGTIHGLTEARATVRVRVGRQEGLGRGAVYLSDVWAWPGGGLAHDAKDALMRKLCEDAAKAMPAAVGAPALHPLEAGLRLHAWAETEAAVEGMPALARMVCLSPYDAAIHDAVGASVGRSAFDFYDDAFSMPVDRYFHDGRAIDAIRRTLRAPAGDLDGWVVVSADNCDERSLAPWVRDRGFRCFKLKVPGADPRADALLTAQLNRVVRGLGVAAPRFAVDPNCGAPDAGAVLEYLSCLRAIDEAAFEALEYIEQPTARDIAESPQDWRAVAQLKHVVLDEGLVGLPSLVEAHRQGWTGIAIKTCKGHSPALVEAAWAHEHGMALFMQDLTNPGAAAVHSALLAAHLPVVNGLELNSPQYTPEANAEWLPRLADLFEPTAGRHHIPHPTPVGLGGNI